MLVFVALRSHIRCVGVWGAWFGFKCFSDLWGVFFSGVRAQRFAIFFTFYLRTY